MTFLQWLFGTDDQADELRARVAELEAEVESLRRLNRQLTTSLELQRTLIRSLRDVNADLDRRTA